MSLFGNTKVRECIIGNIHTLKQIPGYSAYEIAVKHGFKGTEEEWLASLKGKDGEKGEKGDTGQMEAHGGIDALGERIENVADPVEDGDAVNKRHFEGVIAESLEYVNNKAAESVETAIAYADETFVALGYEDITDRFISVKEGFNLPEITKISVFKKDREIRGLIELDMTGFTNGMMCFVNNDYLPEHTVIVDAVVIGNESVPVGEYFPVMLKYITSDQFVCWKPVPEGASKMLLNFSYICKENEVTV